ncbi:hypothetical protein J2776_000845 [Paraburkholderia caledonica]|uniref:Uncharacterized protein n=1 Tax=Paraburkholderia caledonica TaxID=134536 RepID=A0ABU1KT95_9BURK|nr:hypothetical protein [Paraburkholderia caledonica]
MELAYIEISSQEETRILLDDLSVYFPQISVDEKELREDLAHPSPPHCGRLQPDQVQPTSHEYLTSRRAPAVVSCLSPVKK